MLNNINMEFIQAFNPLYAVPIVAVIFCAFIVYAFGFKSPVPPPSFDGIEEEKKYSKKRRAKESQKSNKLLQNGKLNGSAVNKSNVVSSSKKKDASEKNAAIEKPINVEKSSVIDKKAYKKNKLQNEKKTPQEKKKESVPHDDLNDDGWVQLISKKGRKNRKRDDVSVSETQSNATTLAKVEETNKSYDSSQVEESPKRNVELPKDSSFDQKQPISLSKTKANTTKEEGVVSNVEKPKMQNIVVEVPKSDNNNIEKQPLKEAAPKGSKVLEESNKSKKKKKKIVDSGVPENESTGKIISNVSESSAVKVISESPASQETTTTTITPTIIAEISQSIGKVEVDQPSEVKSSNVAFDELAGLYPETKEQKKKKKVRRDH